MNLRDLKQQGWSVSSLAEQLDLRWAGQPHRAGNILLQNLEGEWAAIQWFTSRSRPMLLGVVSRHGPDLIVAVIEPMPLGGRNLRGKFSMRYFGGAGL